MIGISEELYQQLIQYFESQPATKETWQIYSALLKVKQELKEKTKMKWNEGDKLTHPESGEGVVQKVFYWESKADSCLMIYYKNGYCGTGTDQATHEQNGWRKVN